MNKSSTLVLRPTRFSIIWMLFGSALFVAGGIYYLVEGEYWGLVPLFIGAWSFIDSARKLDPNASYLRLDSEGFTYRSGSEVFFCRWYEVSEFGIWTNPGSNQEFVGFNFVSTKKKDRRHEYDIILNDSCYYRPYGTKLAELLNEWKRNNEATVPEEDFTEVTRPPSFSHTGAVNKGIGGLLLLVIASSLLFWIECQGAKRYKNLKEGEVAVTSVLPESVDAGNEGKLIHVSGEVVTDETLFDHEFGVSVNALKLKRVVEMYQWEEKCSVSSGPIHCTYSKVWSDRVINSQSFSQLQRSLYHRNPDSMQYQSREVVASKVSLGAFTLSRSLVAKINNFTPLDSEKMTRLPIHLSGKARFWPLPDLCGYLYIGRYPYSPEIGDLRIYFRVANSTDMSIVSKQVNNTFEPYSVKDGGTIELLHLGIHAADAMFQSGHESNQMWLWILRLLGFILILIALNLIFKCLSCIVDAVPIVSDIVNMGRGIFSFLLATVLSLVTIAIAWIVYYPWVGIILLVVALTLSIGIKAIIQKRGKAVLE
jgi:hypothetical protein